jgi:uncharacterized protein
MTGHLVARFVVRLTPRGGADRIDGVRDGALLVRVAAAPVEGAANDALVVLLARELAVPRSRIRIARGTNSRRKLLEVEDVVVAVLRSRWPGLDV